MMYGPEKSDPGIVAMKPANKTEQSVAERWSEGRGPRGMRTSNARAGRRAGAACHRRWNAYGKVQTALPSHTRGGSRMLESRTYGSVRGALSNERPYRVRFLLHCMSPKMAQMRSAGMSAVALLFGV
jgi:hypothetical protein